MYDKTKSSTSNSEESSSSFESYEVKHGILCEQYEPFLPPRLIEFSDNSNTQFTVFNKFHFGKYSKADITSLDLKDICGKLRFFSSCILEENAYVTVKNIDFDETMKLVPNRKLTMKPESKIKLFTSRETVFNALKKICDDNPEIEIYLNSQPSLK